MWSQCKDMLSTGCTNTIGAYSPRLYSTACMLEGPRKHVFSRKMGIKVLQASECNELLDPVRARCWIFAQHSQVILQNARTEGLVVLCSVDCQ